MQYHAIPCNTMQYHAIPCKTMQYHAIPCNTMRYYAKPCITMHYHAIPCNTKQYHAIPCNTMQYNAIPCIINNCWRSVPLPCGQYMAIFECDMFSAMGCSLYKLRLMGVQEDIRRVINCTIRSLVLALPPWYVSCNRFKTSNFANVSKSKSLPRKVDGKWSRQTGADRLHYGKWVLMKRPHISLSGSSTVD